MVNYKDKSDAEKGMIDRINAERLKHKYDGKTLGTIAKNYRQAEQLSEINRKDTAVNFKDCLKDSGINSKNISTYQGWIAKRMSQGEFGGLKYNEERTLFNYNQNSSKTLDEQLRSMDGNAEDGNFR